MARSEKRIRPKVRSTSEFADLDRTAEQTEPIYRGIGWGTFVVSLLVISLSLLAAYSNVIHGEFVFDDEGTVVENDSIRSIWPLSQSLWAAKDLPTAGRPVANFSFALNYALGQLQVVGYHLTNIVLHALNAVLLLAWTHRTLSTATRWKLRPRAVWGMSLAIAVLWALHPIQTESVAYVTQRTELLMAFFFLSTMYASKRAWDAKEPRATILWQSVAILCCGLGMASKEVMVVAPVMVILYDLTIHRQSVTEAFRRRWLFYLGLMATWGILAALMATDPRGGSVGFHLTIKPIDYLTTQFWAIVYYLWLALWPASLCSDYGVLIVTQFKIWFPCLMLLLAIAGMTLWSWFRRQTYSFLGGWFLIILAPTSSFVPIASEPIAERRMYLPLAALLVFFVVGTVSFMERFAASSKLRSRAWTLLGAIWLMLGVTYAWVTHARNEVYRNELTFWTDVIEKRPDNARGHTNLGLLYIRQSKPDLAKPYFVRAVELAPAEMEFRLNLAVYTEEGNLNEAIAHYEQMVEINPKMDRELCNLGNCYAKLGRIDEALQSYGRAYRLIRQWSKPFTVAVCSIPCSGVGKRQRKIFWPRSKLTRT